MDLDPKLIEQLIQVFVEELEEQLQIVVDVLLQMEKDSDEVDQKELLNTVFRAAHNIKGAARGVEVQDVSDIAHHLESLLSVYKQQGTRPSAEIIDLILKNVDHMRDAMTAFVSKASLPFDMTEVLEELEQAVLSAELNSSSDIQDPVITDKKSDNPPAGKITENKAKTIRKLAGKIAGKTKESEVMAGSDEPEPLSEQAQPEVIASEGNESIRITVDKIVAVSSLAEEIQVSRIEHEDHLKSIHDLQNKVDKLFSIWKKASPLWLKNEVDMAAELKNFLYAGTDIVTELRNNISAVYTNMRGSTGRLGLLCNDLQYDTRMLRLLPAATVLKPMARTVRDIARGMNKEINYKVEGAEIEMDRAILEGIRDPLIHLLRNAIDHGIEMPDERKNKGKKQAGEILVRVESEGSEILISVEDDGAGVDVNTIAASAIKKKMITESELVNMQEDQIMDLIFRPGFSSKDIITDVSGRGVGLDVVRTNLQKLKGNVQLITKQSEGTKFILRLPLTLATDHGLMVKVSGTQYAIPVTSIERVLEIDASDVVNVESTQAILIEGRPVPLRILAQILELPVQEQTSNDSISVVVVSRGWQSVALMVNEIIGEREIVIKPLRPPLISVRNVMGGTLTGSGEIIMVLNASDLVDSALRHGMGKRIFNQTDSTEFIIPSILVVDDSITTRTLEKNILENAGYQVTTAVDGKEAWDILQNTRFDLVVSDVEMPIMDGFTLAENIKQSNTLSDIPVIIVTSLAKDSDRQRGIDVGADAYLVKSQFETRILLDVVAQIV